MVGSSQNIIKVKLRVSFHLYGHLTKMRLLTPSNSALRLGKKRVIKIQTLCCKRCLIIMHSGVDGQAMTVTERMLEQEMIYLDLKRLLLRLWRLKSLRSNSAVLASAGYHCFTIQGA